MNQETLTLTTVKNGKTQEWITIIEDGIMNFLKNWMNYSRRPYKMKMTNRLSKFDAAQVRPFKSAISHLPHFISVKNWKDVILPCPHLQMLYGNCWLIR